LEVKVDRNSVAIDQHIDGPFATVVTRDAERCAALVGPPLPREAPLNAREA
jgi:hypothetical protein